MDEFRDEKEEKGYNEPSVVLGDGVGMIKPEPTLGPDQIPPSFVSLVAGHNNMPGVHTRILYGQLFLYFPNTAGDDGNGGETLLKGDTIAPVTEITMPNVDGDVLLCIN